MKTLALESAESRPALRQDTPDASAGPDEPAVRVHASSHTRGKLAITLA